MTLLEAIKERHSVRSYLPKAMEGNLKQLIQKEIDHCNQKSGLHIQLVTNEPKAFDNFLAHYGKFQGVQNYIALIGKKGSDLEEKSGYYGEHLALFAQTLGLNTCWVAMTFRKKFTKSQCQIVANEKLVCVLALGYGTTNGVPHTSKQLDAVCTNAATAPEWFKQGVEMALLAPTAMNQQNFLFSLHGTSVSAKSTGGFYSKVDLGIVKYHFELGVDGTPFTWG